MAKTHPCRRFAIGTCQKQDKNLDLDFTFQEFDGLEILKASATTQAILHKTYYYFNARLIVNDSIRTEKGLKSHELKPVLGMLSIS